MNNNFKELTDFLDKYGVWYTIHSDSVEVKGDLKLQYKQLTSLPESFGNLKIGGDLYLYVNKLTSLPESFGNLKIGGDLRLDENKLTTLPESFGNLKIKNNLWLEDNNLTSLPESFGNLKIGGSLCFDWHELHRFLPDSFFTSGLYKKNYNKNLDELYSNFLKRKEQEEMIRFKSQIWVIG